MQAQRRPSPPAASPQSNAPAAGSTYRFLVRSAEEAAGVIREQLGPHTKVVSVRSVKATGLSGLLGGTRIEVIAQVQAAPAAPPVTQPSAETPLVSPSEPISAAEALEPAMPSRAQDRLGAAVYRSAASARTNATVESAIASIPTIAPMREEVSARPRKNPPPQRLDVLLRRSGLSEPLIERLSHLGPREAHGEQPLHLGLSAVAAEIRTLARPTKTAPLPSRAAFIGLSGVGRTTALCKWLAAEVVTRGRAGAVATVEFDRPHANEDLAVFAELLGLGFARQVLPAHDTDRSFSYFDLPPLSLTRPEENAKIREYLEDQEIPGRVLVLSALLDPGLLRQACAIGQDLGCTHLVFTHLDELPLWGKLWDFLIDAPLTPLLLSLGPSQTGECETDVVGAVLRRTFPWN